MTVIRGIFGFWARLGWLRKGSLTVFVAYNNPTSASWLEAELFRRLLNWP
jgi:hypothetical protein